MAKVLYATNLFSRFFICQQIGQLVSKKMHLKCRVSPYPSSSVERQTVPDALVSWKRPFPEYDPPQYSNPVIFGKPWADPDITDENFTPKFNEIDGKIDRQSFRCTYEIVDGYPINPIGRTGIKGRGLLGRWGPNHAGDPIVTRWKRNEKGEKVLDQTTGLPRLQFVAIQRSDTKEWAIPGGMVDPGEQVTQTLKREFGEEALNTLQIPEEKKVVIKKKLEELFHNGTTVYEGYVDDPRNTDNAWMETVATSFHDEAGEVIGNIELTAGDDAVGVKWLEVDSSVSLYASHRDFIRKVATLLQAHW